ncbi:MAG: topoisomerase C-terminal repeat-containing protein [Ignavibacteriaceae bacterium]
MLDEFYFPFKEKVDHTIENTERVSGERILGKDPKTGHQVSVRMARFGPVAQLTNLNDEESKPQYAGLRREQKLETITLEEALDLFKLPRNVGEYENEEVVIAIGRFGPYVRHKGKFYSLKKEYDPYTVNIDEAIEVIEAKRKADAEKTIKVFDENPDYKILNGRWGPYLKAGKKNVRLPKDREPESFTLEECIELAENYVPNKGRSKKKKTK